MGFLQESNLISKPPLTLVGYQIRTQNIPGKAEIDIPGLWGKVHTKGLALPDAKADTLYALYSDYEGDYKQPYHCLIGLETGSCPNVPSGMVEVSIPEQTYQVFKVKGPMPESILSTWMAIWDQDETLNRTYTFDFEKYVSPDEVEIYISVARA